MFQGHLQIAYKACVATDVLIYSHEQVCSEIIKNWTTVWEKQRSCKRSTDSSNLYSFFQAKVGLELYLEMVEEASGGLQFRLLIAGLLPTINLCLCLDEDWKHQIMEIWTLWGQVPRLHCPPGKEVWTHLQHIHLKKQLMISASFNVSSPRNKKTLVLTLLTTM